MSELSDNVERKFIDSIDVDEWEIETNTGWVDVTSIHMTVDYDKWVLKTEDGYQLECADDHIVFDEDGEQVFVQNLVPGESRIMTRSGPSLVVAVYNTGIAVPMFDVTVASEEHTLYTNGILSHNTTCVAAYALWCVLFTEEYKIAILANKHAMAKEIIERIQRMYEFIPLWMQQGALTWNKTELAFENGSKIASSSTTGDTIRGKAFNLVYLDEFAFIPNHLQESFFTSVYPTISSGKTTRIIITSTPKGMNKFYKLWKDSENGKNTYVRHSIHWADVPGRDDAWREETIKNTSELQFRQEFECLDWKTLVTIDTDGVIETLPIGELYERLACEDDGEEIICN